MWELDCKESWALKNWCFWTVVLEKTLESPLDCKEIKTADPKGNQFWIVIGRTNAKAEAPILWPPDMKNWFIRTDPDAGKNKAEREEMIEDEMVGWHHCLNAHEFEQAPEVDDGQGILVCCSSMGSQGVGHDWVTDLNWTLTLGNSLSFFWKGFPLRKWFCLLSWDLPFPLLEFSEP